ncbi:MAG: hypothetical protein F4Z26_08025 [Acidimicrobiaceae bacterium]|nr:hypothetical protein [Acidimicrobiaceae bacterium]
MSRGYSVAQTARLVCGLRWACGRLSEILGVWAAQAAAGPEPHAFAAFRLTVLSRRLEAHLETLDGLQPDSELMAAWRQAAPADQALVAALDEMAAMEGPFERLAVAETVIVPALDGVYREIGEHAAPHCDGALASAARALRHDLGGETAVAGAGQLSAAAAIEAADRVLAAAGSLVGPHVLRPNDWA